MDLNLNESVQKAATTLNFGKYMYMCVKKHITELFIKRFAKIVLTHLS